MEDPWSSPWADEIQPQPQPPEPNIPQAPSNVAPRPATPIQTTSLALQQHTSSPWNDEEDDEFGGWAAVPTQAGIGLDGASDDWDTNATEKPLKEVTNEFPTAWGQSPAKEQDPISKLAPSLLPEDVDIVRQPSPDPWAFAMEKPEASFDHLTDARIAESEVTHKATDFEDRGHVEESYSEAPSAEKDDIELAPTTHLASPDQPAVEDRPTIDIQHDGGTGEEESTAAASEEKNTEAKKVKDKTPTPEGAAPILVAEPASSRSSSSHSEHSHRNETFPDSPRTSLEEEPKRPKVPRKVSKVKELVEHFDTLAKPEEDLGMASGRSSAAGGRIELPEDPVDEMDDFGDFEEGQSDDEGPAEQGSPGLVVPKVRTSEIRNIEPENSPMETREKDNRRVEFAPDLSLFDKLYPGAENQSPAKKVFVPDAVPRDSFTSSEQRKTWYRVSRYGPMRKHNTGDDENYVRVNWTKSQIRTDTLNIVARWIEEDRISGRVVLGGGSKAGSIFGWNDAKSKPAPIPAVFATKVVPKKPESAPVRPVAEIPREWPKGLVRERSTSKGRSSTTERRSSVKSAKSVEESKSAQSPVASFGWNIIPEPEKSTSAQPPQTKRTSGSILSTSSPIANSPQRQRRSSSRQSSTSHVSKPLPSDVKSQSIIKLPHTTPTTKPPLPKIVPDMPLAPLQRRLSLEDDEWGEMVASPVIAAPPILPSPIFPQLNGLCHKKSQSFGGAMTFTAQPTEIPRSSLQSTRDHQTTVSFGPILTPESRSPQSADPSKTEGTIPSNSASNDLFSISNVQSQRPTAPPTPSTSADPWASADFSFFDTAPAPAPAREPAFPQLCSKSPMSAPPLESAASPAVGPIPTKTVSFASTRSRATSSIATTPRSGKSREEMEQDRIVQNVIRGLPDLSYMLKR